MAQQSPQASANNPQVIAGRGLYALIQPNNPATSPSSSFTSFDDLFVHGWRRISGQKEAEFKTLEEFEFPAFFYHGLHQQNPANVKDIEWHHDATVARFCNLWNVHDGIIFVTDQVSPAGARGPNNAHMWPQGNVPVGPLPALKNWSDVTYLQWVELCRVNGIPIKLLNRVVYCNITEPTTVRLLEAYCNTGKGPCDYPGRMFTPGDNEFYGLLATANAKGLVYLLAQHKGASELGHKTITGVQVLKGGVTKRWYMKFEVA